MSEDTTLDDFVAEQATEKKEPSETDLMTSLDETSTGSIPSDWSAVRLGELTRDTLYGANESAEEYDPRKPRYIRIKDIDEHGRLKNDEKASLSREKAEGYFLKKGDLLFARSGSPGRTYLHRHNDRDYCYGGYSIKHELVSEGLNREYISQYTKSQKYWDWIERIARTGAQANINSGEYASLLLPLPQIEEQRKIATVLHTVDQAIQKTDQIEKHVLRVKKGLLQDLLNQGLDNSFPQKKDTDLGTVPEHWECVTIEDIIGDEENAFTDGARYALSSDEIHEEGDARAILLEEVGEGEFNDSSPKFATQEKYDEITHRAIYPGEVVVAKMAEPVARACIVPDTYDQYLLGCADVVRIVPNEEVDDRFLMYCMNSYKLWKQAVAHLRGTGRSRINLENISDLKIPKPPLSEQREIVDILREYDRRIKNERAYRDQLKRLKQGLMQDLLSGTVRTTDTNIEVSEEIRQHG